MPELSFNLREKSSGFRRRESEKRGLVIAKSLEEQGADRALQRAFRSAEEIARGAARRQTGFRLRRRTRRAAARLAAEVVAAATALHGIVHSIAFANYSDGFKAFHETKRADFLQATAVSAFSLVEIAQAFKRTSATMPRSSRSGFRRCW